MHASAVCLFVCLSVCLSNCHTHGTVEMATRIIKPYRHLVVPSYFQPTNIFKVTLKVELNFWLSQKRCNIGRGSQKIYRTLFHTRFIPARRYAGAGISRRRVSVCLCVSVIRRHCIKTAKRRITQTTPHSPGTLVFWRQNSLVDDPPSVWNLCSKWPTPLSNSAISTNICSYRLNRKSQRKKVQIALIGSRPRAL